MKSAIYPGSFDPMTLGHLDLIQRAARVFDKVIVAVANNTAKESLFTISERVAILKETTKDMPGVSVETFNGLVIDFARAKGVHILIRGLRMISDFEYEFQMALTNRKLAPDIETIFLMPQEGYSYLSSKLLKEAVSLGADISCFVPNFVDQALKDKLRR